MYNFILNSINKTLYNNIAPKVYTKNLKQSLIDAHQAIALSTQLHPYIHYLASVTYMFRAYTNLFLNSINAAEQDLEQALFQDHNNQDALKCINYIRSKKTKSYDWLLQKTSQNYFEEITTAFADKTIDLPEEFQAITLDSSSDNSYLQLGIKYFFHKQFPEAKQNLDKALNILIKEHNNYHLNSSIEFYKRASIYYRMLNLDLALNDLNKSLSLYKQNLEALLLRAKIYSYKKSYPDALEDLSYILSHTKSPEALALHKLITRKLMAVNR